MLGFGRDGNNRHPMRNAASMTRWTSSRGGNLII